MMFCNVTDGTNTHDMIKDPLFMRRPATAAGVAGRAFTALDTGYGQVMLLKLAAV